jgi:hypothetical protein
MRLFVACAVILFGTLVGAQNHKQPAENENKSNHTTNNPQPATTIPEVHACSPAIEQTTQSKQQAADAVSRPFLTHGEWVMAILTAIYVGISYFGLRAIKQQADIAQSTADAIVDAERAWIDIDLRKFGVNYSFIVTNYGKTHGIITEYGLIFSHMTREDYSDLPRKIRAKEEWGGKDPVEVYSMLMPHKPWEILKLDPATFQSTIPNSVSVIGAYVEYDSIGGPYRTDVVYVVQQDLLNKVPMLVNRHDLTRYERIDT